MAAVISKSAITPSFIGRMATMLPGVRPSISFASLPTARTFFVPDAPRWTATTEGSLATMPFPRTKVRVVAVPRSIAKSFENNPYTQSNSIGVVLGGASLGLGSQVANLAKRLPDQSVAHHTYHSVVIDRKGLNGVAR